MTLKDLVGMIDRDPYLALVHRLRRPEPMLVVARLLERDKIVFTLAEIAGLTPEQARRRLHGNEARRTQEVETAATERREM